MGRREIRYAVWVRHYNNEREWWEPYSGTRRYTALDPNSIEEVGHLLPPGEYVIYPLDGEAGEYEILVGEKTVKSVQVIKRDR